MGMDPTVMGIIGGAALGAGLGGMQKAPSIPAPQAPVAPPAAQAAQVPDAQSFLSKNSGTGQAGGAPGIAQTFLTGAGGIDPSKLDLNRKTLLGS